MTVGTRLGLAQTFAISRWCSDRSVARGERGLGVFINFGSDEVHNALSATGAVSRRCILFLLDPRGTAIGYKDGYATWPLRRPGGRRSRSGASADARAANF